MNVLFDLLNFGWLQPATSGGWREYPFDSNICGVENEFTGKSVKKKIAYRFAGT